MWTQKPWPRPKHFFLFPLTYLISYDELLLVRVEGDRVDRRLRLIVPLAVEVAHSKVPNADAAIFASYMRLPEVTNSTFLTCCTASTCNTAHWGVVLHHPTVNNCLPIRSCRVVCTTKIDLFLIFAVRHDSTLWVSDFNCQDDAVRHLSVVSDVNKSNFV
jgi:hypothetical protein